MTTHANPTPDKMTLYEMRARSPRVAGIRVEEIAKLCKTTYQSLRNWENGKTIPNIMNIEHMLLVYGYTYDQLDVSPFAQLFLEKENKNETYTNDRIHAIHADLTERRQQHAFSVHAAPSPMEQTKA